MSSLGNKEIMAKNIKRYMELLQKDRNDICRDLGFKYTTFTDWINGNTYPRIDKIELMANYFGISKSDLVEEPSPKPNIPLIMDYYNKLNAIGKEEATKRVEELTYLPRYTAAMQSETPPHLLLNAAHERTDIDVTDEMKKHDDDIMDDDEFWK